MVISPGLVEAADLQTDMGVSQDAAFPIREGTCWLLSIFRPFAQDTLVLRPMHCTLCCCLDKILQPSVPQKPHSKMAIKSSLLLLFNLVAPSVIQLTHILLSSFIFWPQHVLDYLANHVLLSTKIPTDNGMHRHELIKFDMYCKKQNDCASEICGKAAIAE